MSTYPKSQLLEHLFLILDVDGVVRDSIEEPADPRVIEAIKKLLHTHPSIRVAFLSGTPVTNNRTLERWRKGNVPLDHAFKNIFWNEMQANQVYIYGMLGSHKMTWEGRTEVLDSYPLSRSFELGRLMLHAFLKEVLNEGTIEQQNLAAHLEQNLLALTLDNPHQPEDATAEEFAAIMNRIRKDLDPEFRLINNGASLESHTTVSFYNASRATTFIKKNIPFLLLDKAPHIATGIAKKGNHEFYFLLLSKNDKGKTAQHLISNQLNITPEALVITVGDTQIDFPMHAHAHLSFHVGLEQVWQEHPLPHCILVRDTQGKDKQHVEGTLKVLELIQQGIGKPFYEFKHIPQKNSLGKWEYCSLRELEESRK